MSILAGALNEDEINGNEVDGAGYTPQLVGKVLIGKILNPFPYDTTLGLEPELTIRYERRSVRIARERRTERVRS